MTNTLEGLNYKIEAYEKVVVEKEKELSNNNGKH